MFEFRNYRVWAVGLGLILLLSACGPSSQPDSVISTAVAQTVQAQNTQEAKETAPVATFPAPVDTDTPASVASLPATATNTPLPQTSGGLCTASASLAGETVPDGTIILPGSTFTKSWQIQNTGTCTWDSTWQLTFSGGDQMDGLASYSFPEPAEPGETLNIPIILRAPSGGGTHTGEWMLKSPWGQTFGVGQYSVPVTVSISVGSGTPENKKTETVFGVTAVTYQVERRCTAANTFYTITANLTTNGPSEVTFTWVQSDGNNEPNNKLSFPEAMTKSSEREWIQNSTGSSPNQRWVQIIVTSPGYQEFTQFLLPKLCGQD